MTSHKLDIYFGAAFAFCLYFPTRAPTYCLELYGLYIAVDSIRNKQIGSMHLRSEHLYLYQFFLVCLASILLSDTSTDLWPQIEKRVSFILIPIIFVVRSQFYTPKSVPTILLSFVLGSVAASAVDFMRAVYRSIEINGGSIHFDAAVIKGKSFSDSIVYGGNYFFYEDYSWFMHPTHFSIYLLFSICLIFEYMATNDLSRRLRFFYGSIVLWFLLNIYMLSSRAVLLCSLIILLFWAVRIVRKLTTTKLILGGVFAILLTGALVSSNPRIALLFEFDEIVSNNQRLHIWTAGKSIIKSNFVWGTGLLDLPLELKEAYLDRQYSEGIRRNYNFHNQFLETLAGSGLIGLSSLMLLFYGVLSQALRKRNLTLTQFMTIFTFNMLFESMLNVYSGIVFLCFFVCLLSLLPPSRSAIK